MPEGTKNSFAHVLEPGQELNGFVVVSAEAVPETRGWAYVMQHQATGARLLWLANADQNRAFSISFKTPPTNDSGVFHILEHSVLNGSQKYPVKEPFVNLLKTSMQTFLNAMTFSDKTMYPVASTNVQDLENLMDVYLDAVLHPNIYTRPRIFEQEGWHYELEDLDSPLTVNGVVYNEMKGALSDPEDVLFMHMKRQLFPKTCYRYESGGNPAAIVELTYQQFLDQHARHYTLENSYTMLYGDLDIARELAFLDERFAGARNRGAGAPNELAAQAPVVAEPLVAPLATAPENACVGVGYVLGTWDQHEDMIAADILLDTLMGSNEAPLKRRLLDAGLGNDVYAQLIDGVLQPFVVFVLKGAKPGVAAEFKELIEKSAAELVEAGLPTDRLEASLAQAEFELRECDFGYPAGISYAITAMSGWLHSDDAATMYLHYEDACRDLGKSMGLGVFEKLLERTIVKSNHNCVVTIQPVEGAGTAAEAERLEAAKAAMSTPELEAIMVEQVALKEEQATPDSPEDLARLPHLGIADIQEAPADPAERTVEAPYPCTSYEIDTNRIAYTYQYFDLRCVSFEELPYVSILAMLIGKLDTRLHTAAELDCLLEANLGSFSTFVESYNDADNPLFATEPKLVVSAAALSEKITALATLPLEVCCQTQFGDLDRIYATLVQRRLAMEQTFMTAGHSVALARNRSAYSASARITEQCGGIDFYYTLCELLDNWDERAADLTATLERLQAKIFVGANLEMSFAGAPGDVERYWEAAGDLGLLPGTHVACLEVPAPKAESEGFAVPATVCFVVQGAALATLPGHDATYRYSGQWLVATRVLGYGYLWNEIRVLGGAYGAGFIATTSSLLDFYSFRDPAVDPTLARYRAAGAWLGSWQETGDDLEGYIVATVAQLDAPMRPRALMRRQDVLRLTHTPADWRMKIRSEALATTAEDIRALAPAVTAVGEDGIVTVVGGKELLEASNAELKITELL